MPPRTEAALRVGTRGSALAAAQTELAVAALRAHSYGFEPEVVVIKTAGDRAPDRPYAEIGPKGVFARELQRALLSGEIDVAVHSLKDLTATEPDGLELAAVLERADPRDVLVAPSPTSLADLPAGARVGTSSARRRALLRIERPDLEVVGLRGNVDTRLAKTARGEVDAAILAGAGLLRLGRGDAATEWLDPSVFVPPPGQGAVVIEARADRLEGDLTWLREADHPASRSAVEAERLFMQALEGGCEVPIGAWARWEGGSLLCDGFVSSPDGSRHLRGRAAGKDAPEVGLGLTRQLLEQGAADLVRSLRP